MSKKLSKYLKLSASIGFLLIMMLVLAACQGPEGPPGVQGPPGAQGLPGESAVIEEEPAEVDPVVVNAGDDVTGEPETAVTLQGAVTINDGSTVSSYEWTQVSGAVASLGDASGKSIEVTLAGSDAYREKLVENINPLDRFGVAGIDPHSLEEAEAAVFNLTVVTSSGSYSDTVAVHTPLPYVVSLGLENVPQGLPVLIQSVAQGGYDWSLTAPSGATAALDDASIANPSFTPDKNGKYTLTENLSGQTVDVYAGTWSGAISGIDSDGLPLSESCTGCHDGEIASDQFASWRESGHASIFSTQINTSTHYGEGCLACHTVGYEKDVDNGGVDDASDYSGLIDSGMLHDADMDNWATVIADYPNTARMANIQCENCHGPNSGSTLHANGEIEVARVSISSDACGSCHGEPARHGRFQQWEESNHANYTLAIERATNTSCARCHVGQGFIAWLPQLDAGDSGSLKAEMITWDEETSHPVTCATCHDSHSLGTKSGEPNDVVLRVSGSTAMLPSGFKAEAVGNGALCITCHNSRNGERNDTAMATQDDRVPHTASQADVLMGENAYFVETGNRSSHSLIENTCTNCHMVVSPPPAEFSYNLGGTNHTFEASPDICADCHGELTAAPLEAATEAKLHELQAAIEQAILAEINAQTDAGNTVVLLGFGTDDTDVNITDGSTVESVTLTEYHGRQSMDIVVSGTHYEHINLARGTAVGSGTLITSAKGQLIAKAGWNFYLIEGDGSEGIHNPSFTLQVLNASIKALK